MLTPREKAAVLRAAEKIEREDLMLNDAMSQRLLCGFDNLFYPASYMGEGLGAKHWRALALCFFATAPRSVWEESE